MATASKSKPLGLSIMIGIVIGTLAAVLSSHFAVWLIAGIFVGIAAGAAVGRKKCPDCQARETGATSYEVQALGPQPRAQSQRLIPKT
jgi:hypothetical protein